MKIRFNQDNLKHYMIKCIELAKKFPPKIRPPYVGALVLSRNCEVVGEGYKKFVEHTKLVIHAERMALNYAGNLAKKGCLITTLEPCIRANRNQIFSSCSELIVESGIDTVVIALLDYSPSVISSGQGINFLKERGIKVIRYGGLNETIERELMLCRYRSNFSA